MSLFISDIDESSASGETVPFVFYKDNSQIPAKLATIYEVSNTNPK